MGTSKLNIRDAEAKRLARELAQLTGESQTEAVRKALAERLARKKNEHAASAKRNADEQRREFERIWPKIRKIQESIRRRGFTDETYTDHDLYDESGLPN